MEACALIEFDPDRFYVRVTDAAANTDPTTKQSVTVQISTDSPGTDYDDAADTITLIETDVNTGVFESKSLMLIADDVDDDHPVDGVQDDTHNDRTHKIALEGTLKVEYQTGGGTKYYHAAYVRVEKTLTIPKIYIHRDKALANGGVPVIDTNDATAIDAVKAHVKWANERYAQAGIQIKVTEVKIVDPPTGVDLLTPLGLDLFHPTLTAEEKALFDALGTADRDDIIVFYVNDFTGSNRTGEQTNEGFLPNEEDKRVNNVVIDAQDGNHGTFSHELLHVLLQSGHDGSTRQYVFYGNKAPVDDVDQKRRLTVSLVAPEIVQGSRQRPIAFNRLTIFSRS